VRRGPPQKTDACLHWDQHDFPPVIKRTIPRDSAVAPRRASAPSASSLVDVRPHPSPSAERPRSSVFHPGPGIFCPIPVPPVCRGWTPNSASGFSGSSATRVEPRQCPRAPRPNPRRSGPTARKLGWAVGMGADMPSPRRAQAPSPALPSSAVRVPPQRVEDQLDSGGWRARRINSGCPSPACDSRMAFVPEPQRLFKERVLAGPHWPGCRHARLPMCRPTSIAARPTPPPGCCGISTRPRSALSRPITTDQCFAQT